MCGLPENRYYTLKNAQIHSQISHIYFILL